MRHLADVTVTGPRRSHWVAKLTGGRGLDACIDAVGMEAHGAHALSDLYDRVKQKLLLATDRGDVVRQMVACCRKGGTLSVIGAYGMFVDKFPLGAAFNTHRLPLDDAPRACKLFKHKEDRCVKIALVP